MRSTTLSLLALASLLTACPTGGGEDPLPTPDFVGDSDLNVYLFAHFDATEPLEMQQGVEALEESLAAVNLTGDQADRRWDMTAPLTPDDYGGANIWEGADPLDQIIVSVAGRSAHDVTDLGGLIPIADQTPFESASSVEYNRTVVGDGNAFVAQTIDVLETDNEVHRQNFILNVWYDTPKFFRWIELSDGRKALVARAWLEQAYEGENGTNSLEQFTAMEVRIPDANGTVLYTTVWGFLRPSIGDTVLANSVANGIDEGWENTEAHLDAN